MTQHRVNTANGTETAPADGNKVADLSAAIAVVSGAKTRPRGRSKCGLGAGEPQVLDSVQERNGAAGGEIPPLDYVIYYIYMICDASGVTSAFLGL